MEEEITKPHSDSRIEIPAQVELLPVSIDGDVRETRRGWYRYVVLPMLMLTVALLGGLRVSALDGAFIFLGPSLLYLIFAVLLIVLFIRAGFIRIDGWFSEDLPLLANAANGIVLLSLFAASAQVFNALIPEQGLPFWVVSFCFLWTLWNDLFAEFDARRLLRSLGALFGIAFVTKYLVLANLAAQGDSGWLRRLIEDPAKTTFAWLLDVPDLSPATGFIQFATVGIFIIGLLLLPVTARSDK